MAEFLLFPPISGRPSILILLVRQGEEVLTFIVKGRVWQILVRKLK